MTNKKELNKEELNKVSGGIKRLDIYPDYINEIDQYDTVNYINQVLYFEYVNGSKWIFGALLNSYEKSVECGTQRTATVKVIESNKYTNGETLDISLFNWRTFSK